MKRFIKFLFISAIVVSISFGILKLKNNYDVKVFNKDLSWLIKLKGIEKAKSFDFDNEGNLYIAFQDTIRIVNNDGNNKVIIRESKLDILDIIYHKEKLYIATDNRIIEYDLKKNNYKDIVTNIPNLGINKKVNLLIKEDNLFFSVGSNTNDGIVEKKGDKEEVPTLTWILNGYNFGPENTGIFTSYSISTENGEKVEGNIIGNASIMKYNIAIGELELYAHGLRNVTGWDFNKEGKIIASIGGIENKEPRNINNDKDYIYNISEDRWYGWPDYSGGDPITSPRFYGGSENKFLIKNHIDKNPSKGIYQHNSVSSIYGLAIDKEGKVIEEDEIIFSDIKDGGIYSLNKKLKLKKIIDLEEGSKIEKIKELDGKFYILDSGFGCLFELSKANKISSIGINKIAILGSVILLISLIFGLTERRRKKKMNKTKD
ncbi:hypothetical protein [Clostridium sp.]|uniref:hypothetical protein n=1 Tax=Clostridium sp. TaxID=1506 RepID=UPI002610F322|nr:hypothetical protein [Clostridium sp.]